MKLRELINKLESISNNGKNDDLDVDVWTSFVENNMIGDNHMCDPVKNVWIDTFVSPNDEYNFVMIEI